MRFVPLLLLLSLSAFSEPVYTIGEAQKQAILQRLDSLESKLQTVSGKLANSENLTLKLSSDLEVLSKDLRQAKEMLEQYETKLSEVQDLLTKASETLNTLERRLKDYQFWEVVKIVAASAISLGLGFLLGHL